MHDLISCILRLNGLERRHYIEPYAGGCGLALSLLYGGHVADIHINDIDPSIWAFWHCVLNETDALVERIETTPITIEEWRQQREIHRRRRADDLLSLGFATFFLNRTNRSGVIGSGGVIGGYSQTGKYKIDCRFNRDDMVRRIRRIRKYYDRIHLTNLDAVEFITYCESSLPASSFFYIDPPYFKKGAELYTSFYTREDHGVVAERIFSLHRPWVVTYDDTPEIRTLYSGQRQYSFDIYYSLQNKRTGAELLIPSKGLLIPDGLLNRDLSEQA